MAHRIVGQARNAASHSARIPNLDIVKMHTIDTPHMVDGNDRLHISPAREITPSTITQADEDGRLGALNGEIRDIDILQYTTIDDLQRDGRRTYPLTEELLLLIAAGLHHNARDVDVTEATIGLCSQFDSIAMARHHTIGDTHILTQTGRSGLQCNAIIITIGHDPFHNHIVAAIDIKGIIIIVIAVKNLDSIDAQAVAGQIVLHPTATVLQRDILHGDVLALDEPQQVGTGDASFHESFLNALPRPSIVP